MGRYDKLEQLDRLLIRASREQNPYASEEQLHEGRRMLREIATEIRTPTTERGMAAAARNIITPDQIHPPPHSRMLQPLMAPDRWYTLPIRSEVPPGEISAPPAILDFQSKAGWLIGMRGTSTDFTIGSFAAGRFEQASLGVKIRINDAEPLTTNTNDADFILFSDLFGDAVQWSPIMRWIEPTDTMTVEFQNFQPPAPDGHTLTASLTFAFWRKEYPGT